ncbi:MAG TPA: glycosyltransferase family 87 protein [Pirellulales bacterium]|nr:glycosyltransferase family 87 protein [Pirellulales bacterium]
MRHFTVSASQLRSTDGPRSPGSWLAWCRDRTPLLAAVAFFLAMFWPFMRKGEEGEWRRCFLRAAYRLQARQIIHRPYEANTYAYPPAMAMLAVPLAQLPFRWSLGGWYLANVAAMIAVVTCAWRLTGGPPLGRLVRPWSHVYWLGLLLASRFLVAPLENQQFDVVITAVLFAGCLALSRGCDNLAGLALGTAAAMKCTPLLFAPYLVWRGRWRSAALLLFTAVALNRLPDFFWPRADGGSYLGDWVGTFLIKVAKTAPGVWDSDLILNQSVSGLVNRFVQSGLPLSVAQIPSALTSLPASTIVAIRLLTYGLSGALLLATGWTCGLPGKTREVRSFAGTTVPWFELQAGVEVSALVCLMLLLSPMSSKAHYVVLLLPCMLLARAVVEGRCDWKRWLLPLAVLGPLTAKGITGKPLGDLMLAWGFPTWFVLVLLAAMWQLRRDCVTEEAGAVAFCDRLPKAA